MRYLVIWAASPEMLRMEVTDYLGKGWQLRGQLIVVPHDRHTELRFFQVLTKDGPTEPHG